MASVGTKLEAEVAMFSGKQGKTWNTCSGDSLQSGKQYGVEKGPTENHSDLRLELLRKSLVPGSFEASYPGISRHSAVCVPWKARCGSRPRVGLGS